MKTLNKKTKLIIPQEIIKERVIYIRGIKVMLDRDLAKLYCVEKKFSTKPSNGTSNDSQQTSCFN